MQQRRAMPLLLLICTEVPSQMVNGLFNETLMDLLVFCIIARVFIDVKLRCKLACLCVVEVIGIG